MSFFNDVGNIFYLGFYREIICHCPFNGDFLVSDHLLVFDYLSFIRDPVDVLVSVNLGIFPLERDVLNPTLHRNFFSTNVLRTNVLRTNVLRTNVLRRRVQ